MTKKKELSNKQSWNYAVGLIKIEGLTPSADFQKYIELEKRGQASTKDLKKYLDKKYRAKK